MDEGIGEIVDERVGISYLKESWGSAFQTTSNHSASKIQGNDQSLNGGRINEGK